MAHKINAELCTSCGLCAGECPVECISEGEGSYVIDAAACVDCGACVPVCPVEAISAE
ncbi:4Fe-4S binding protein [bacterium]|nr:4Fe-4S binding protein [bacterium]